MNYIFSKKKSEIGDSGIIIGNRFFPMSSSSKTWNDDFLNSYDSNLFILSNIETNIYGQFTEIPEQNRQTEDGVWSNCSTKYTNNNYMSLKLNDEVKDFKSILFSYWWKKTTSSQYNQYALGSDYCSGDNPHNCLHSDELSSGYGHGWRTWVVADGGCRQINTGNYNEWNNYVVYYNRPSGKLYVSVNNSAFQIGTCTSADIPCCSSSGKPYLTLYMHSNTKFGGFVMWHDLELEEEEFRTFSEKLANPEIKPFNKKKKLKIEQLEITSPTNLTSNTSDANFEINSDSVFGDNYPLYKAFDGKNGGYLDGWLSEEISLPHWISFKSKSSSKILCSKYEIAPAWSSSNNAPCSWQLLGSNNGIDYDVLDEQNNFVMSKDSKKYMFNLNKTYSYNEYKLYVTKNQENIHTYTGIGEFVTYKVK